MMTRLILTRKSGILVVLLIFMGLFAGCNNDKSDNSKPFEFLGEAIGRPENFDKDTIVTPKNIDSLYRQYTVEALLGGDYYLVRSKKSYTTSRYLSRLIQMKNGRQVAARTFYDSEIDANAVVRLKNRLIVGLNSLRNNYYDSTYHQTTHKCRIFALSDSLTPIIGKRFCSQKGHTYIESLMQDSDSTFFCSIVSGDVEITSYSYYQFQARYDLSIDRQIAITNRSEYEIKNDAVNLFIIRGDWGNNRGDWSNDLSDEKLFKMKLKKREIMNNKSEKKPYIPSDFILVPGGHLSYKDGIYEGPKTHDVDIDTFYICAYELTQGEYKRVMGNLQRFNYLWLLKESWYIDEGPIYNEVKGENIPVRGSLRDFAEYCNKRSIQEGFDGFYIITNDSIKIKENGNGYRLITPYEWIHAAFGGKNVKQKYLGGKNLDEVAWHLGNSKSKPHPVGLKKPNDIGIFDMQGNAPEILQGDSKYKCYTSMMDGYNVSNWNYPQTYDIIYIYSPPESDLLERTYGTRIAFIPKGLNNRNLKRSYKYKYSKD